MNQSEIISAIFNSTHNNPQTQNVVFGVCERCLYDWNESFDLCIRKFIQTAREKGFACDLLGSQRIQNGKAVLLSFGELNSQYRERFQIFYSGLEIDFRYVE